LLHKTPGICLRTTPYGETSLVVRIYTELFGMQSYLVNGVRTRKSRFPANLFQPFTMLDMVVYYKDHGGLQRISEVKAQPPLNSLPYDIHKTAVAVFMAELFDHAVQEVEPNPELFAWLCNEVLFLDELQTGIAHVHVHFMLQLASQLGFQLQNNYGPAFPIFDLQEGRFVPAVPAHRHAISEPLSGQLNQLLGVSPVAIQAIAMPRASRNQLIEKLLHYYSLHLQGFRAPVSHLVLEQVFG